MLKNLYAGFAVDDLDKAKDFYEHTLQLQLKMEGQGAIRHLIIDAPGGGCVEVYPKPDFTPAAFTVMNLVVDNIDEMVDDLSAKGVSFERYEGYAQDEKSIIRSKDPTQGPSIAWFKDPAGNVFAILEVE